MRVALLAVCCAAGLLVGPTHASDEDPGVDIAQLLGIPADYAGISPDHLTMVDVAVVQATHASHYYYKLTGHWPANWQAVVDAGLFTAQLRTPFHTVINPDDGQGDCNYDLLFNPDGQSPPQLATYRQGEKRQFKYHEMPVGSVPFSNGIKQMKAALPFGAPANPLEVHADDEEFLKAYAAGCVMQQLLSEAWVWHKVNTWDEFVESGFFPQAADSLNPLTGKPWAADGEPGSLVMSPSTGPNKLPCLRLVDPDTGQPIGLWM